MRTRGTLFGDSRIAQSTADRNVARRPGNGPVRLLILSIGGARYPRLATSLDRAKSNHMWHWFPHLRASRGQPWSAVTRLSQPKSGAADDNEAVIVVALVLLVLVAVFTLAIVLSNPDVYELSLFRVLIPVTSAGVYLTGVGAAVLIAGRLGHAAGGPPPPSGATPRAEVRRQPWPPAPSAAPDPVDPDPTPPTRAGPRRSTWIVRRPRPPSGRPCSTRWTGSRPTTAAK